MRVGRNFFSGLEVRPLQARRQSLGPLSSADFSSPYRMEGPAGHWRPIYCLNRSYPGFPRLFRPREVPAP